VKKTVDTSSTRGGFLLPRGTSGATLSSEADVASPAAGKPERPAPIGEARALRQVTAGPTSEFAHRVRPEFPLRPVTRNPRAARPRWYSRPPAWVEAGPETRGEGRAVFTARAAEPPAIAFGRGFA